MSDTTTTNVNIADLACGKVKSVIQKILETELARYDGGDLKARGVLRWCGDSVEFVYDGESMFRIAWSVELEHTPATNGG